MSSISISRADVEAVIDRNPWDLVREFDGNTDPEVIASLSRIFHNGVAEAEESGSVAEYASNLAERAGSQGVNAIYEDAADHLEETYAGLGAETMASISRTLLSISEEAARVLEFNQEALEGEHGVNRMINWHAAQGSSEYQAVVDWHAEQSTEVAAETQLVYNIHGRSFQGTPNEFPFDDAKAGIKEGRTELAGEYAEEVHDGIDDEIGEYYAYLGRREAELAEQGYDVSTSPVNFYYTPEIAAYHAEKIAEALAALEHNENDPQALAALEHSTHAMGELAGRFFDADGNPVGTMSDQQLEYLRTVFDGLDADHLVTIGHLDIEGIDRVQENLGNGILLLTNPDVGGIDPDLSATSGPQAVPASIRDLMYEVEVGAENAPGFDDRVGYDRHTGEFIVSGLYEYQGLANLLGASTIQGGDRFSVELAQSALHVQQQFNAFSDDWGDSDLMPAVTRSGEVVWLGPEEVAEFRGIDTGASATLDVVSRNIDAGQEFLLDEANLTGVIGTDWRGHEAGAISLVESATERGQVTAENAQQAAQIAESIFATVGDDPTSWRALVPKGSAMSDLLVDVAAQYIDAFANDLTADGRPVGGDAVQGEDGLFYADFLLSGRSNDSDNGMRFLDFVGLGYSGDDVDEFMLDPDFAKLNLAAYAAARGMFADSIGNGFGWPEAEESYGYLHGNLMHAEITSAMNFAQNAYEAEKLAAERKKMYTDLAVDTLVSHPVGKGIKKIGTEVIQNVLTAMYKEEVEGPLKKLLADVPDNSGVTEFRYETMVAILAETETALNYTAIEAMHEAGTLSGSRAEKLLEIGDDSLPGRDQLSNPTVRSLINAIYDTTTVMDDGVRHSLDNGGISGHSDQFLQAALLHEPSAYDEIDPILIGDAVYGAARENWGDVTPASGAASRQDWLN